MRRRWPPGLGPIPTGATRVRSSSRLRRRTGWGPTGTDVTCSRDCVHGARVSLTVGFTAAALSLLLGLPVGALAGYRGGLADAALARTIEAAMCFPALGRHDRPSEHRSALATSAPGHFANRVRPGRGRLDAGRTVSPRRIPEAPRFRRDRRRRRLPGRGTCASSCVHLLPRSLAPVLVNAGVRRRGLVSGRSDALVPRGGNRSADGELGEMLYQAQHHVGGAWWLALFPGAALFIVGPRLQSTRGGDSRLAGSAGASRLTPRGFLRDLLVGARDFGHPAWSASRGGSPSHGRCGARRWTRPSRTGIASSWTCDASPAYPARGVRSSYSRDLETTISSSGLRESRIRELHRSRPRSWSRPHPSSRPTSLGGQSAGKQRQQELRTRSPASAARSRGVALLAAVAFGADRVERHGGLPR